MKTTIYELNYTYYQYNTGAGDNGTYTTKINFTDKEEALKIYRQMQVSVAKNNDAKDETDSQLEDKYLPNSGYFTGAKLIESVREDTPIEEVENKEEYRDYSSCPHCNYDGCSECHDTGKRPLTPASMELAISATEWSNEKIDELWNDYDSVYQLRRGVYSWSMSSTHVYITAGYSCRGSSTTDEYTLPIEWLYAPNRKELIQAEYKKEQAKKGLVQRQTQEQELLRLKSAALALEKQLKG